MTLLAIDPGLDELGWAVLATDGPRIFTHVQAVSRLQAHGSEHTTPTDPIPLRLLQLGEAVTRLIASHQPTWVAIERPAVGFTYRRHRAQQATDQGFMGDTLGSMHLATGSVVLAAARALGADRVLLVAVSSLPKPKRNELLYHLWPALAHRKSNQDERDAIYLGLQALLDSRRRWTVAEVTA